MRISYLTNATQWLYGIDSFQLETDRSSSDWTAESPKTSWPAAWPQTNKKERNLKNRHLKEPAEILAVQHGITSAGIAHFIPLETQLNLGATHLVVAAFLVENFTV